MQRLLLCEQAARHSQMRQAPCTRYSLQLIFSFRSEINWGQALQAGNLLGGPVTIRLSVLNGANAVIIATRVEHVKKIKTYLGEVCSCSLQTTTDDFQPQRAKDGAAMAGALSIKKFSEAGSGNRADPLRDPLLPVQVL